VLRTELFSRPYDRGRVSGSLIQIDHASAMLRKAAILHWGGRIRATLFDAEVKEIMKLIAARTACPKNA